MSPFNKTMALTFFEDEFNVLWQKSDCKLSTGFKIKWNGHLKRRHFDPHKVAGVFSGIFLSLTLITGFIYNFPQFTYPLLCRMTFSTAPPEEFVSKPIAGKAPITLSQALAAIDKAMPEGIFTPDS
jgi:uncharacterized iron-regulated membrane protein